ncbi:MAG: hypothetical protein NTW79_01025 [Candidatus Berkelbacteria bacterium]|nr:hypothetical protein [Candidatus Berkelbacteria bacterium]
MSLREVKQSANDEAILFLSGGFIPSDALIGIPTFAGWRIVGACQNPCACIFSLTFISPFDKLILLFQSEGSWLKMPARKVRVKK